MEESKENKQAQSAAKPAQTKTVKKRRVGYGGYPGYGYGYSNYGNYYGAYYGGGYNSGYGYGTQQPEAPAATTPNRTMRDYLMILRERLWYILVTFAVIFAGVLLYTFRITPEYTAQASVLLLRDSDTPIDGPGSIKRTRNDQISSVEDFNTQVKLLESFEIIRAVKSRLKEEDIRKLMAPYNGMFTLGPKKTEEEILMLNRKILPARMSLFIHVTYTHPNAEMAARIANLFAAEYINYNRMTRVQKLLDSIDELRTKVTQQSAKVKDLDKKLVEYREKNGTSLHRDDDTDRREYQDLNSIRTNDKRAFEAIAVQWKLLQEYKRENKDLCSLPFIVDIPMISKLVTDKSQYQITISTLEKRYKEKHPKMIEARKAIDQNEKELQKHLDSAYEKIHSTYLTLKNNYEQSEKELNKKREEIIQLGRKAIAYDSIEREKKIAEGMHNEFIAAMHVRLAQVSLITDNAKVVDTAGVPNKPSSPNYVLNIIGGLLLAIVGGVGMALAVAFWDDRAKSAYDVETVIGLPLLGSIPRVKRLSSAEKAQVAASNSDHATTEAFRTLYSTLKINNMSKDAKVILSTSTTPSEGKSFVVSNLALTCAMNGEKCIIIDADLRLPTLAKILSLTIKDGIISHIENGKTLDEVIIKDYFPNLDILACEKRASNPSQMLNSEEFINMLEYCREHYDRVFVDSPPVGAVSDALSLLPAVDGVIYVIKFNTTKRKVIRRCVHRMMDSNVPVLGAIMNMVSMRTASDYSMNYYDKSYQNYYTTPPEFVEVEQEEAEDSEQNPKA